MGNIHGYKQQHTEDYISYKYKQRRSRPVYVVGNVVLGNKIIKKRFEKQEDAQEWVEFVRSQIELGNQELVLKMAGSFTN